MCEANAKQVETFQASSFYNLTYKTQLLQETNALDERG